MCPCHSRIAQLAEPPVDNRKRRGSNPRPWTIESIAQVGRAFMNNEYMKTYMLARYVERRAKAVALLGGECRKCGSTQKLHFHHKNPKHKEFTVAAGSSFSDERWNKEIAKCELLCENCHTSEHRPQHECGTPHKYWQGCRCQPCKTVNAAWSRNYKQNRGLSHNG